MSIEIARVLTDQREIQEAYRVYDNVVNGSGEKVNNRIGHAGGVTDVVAYWHKEHRFWSYFDDNRCNNRYWCCFGVDNPRLKYDMDITCEVNIPFNRRIAGALALTSRQTVALLHSGRIGGGRAGIGLEAFLDHYEDAQLVDVVWPDRLFTQHIFIGELESDSFLIELGKFVHAVSKFKDWAVGK